MNPEQLQSITRSILLFALGAAASRMVTKGILTSDQAAALVPEIVTVILGIGGIAVAYLGHRSHSAQEVTAAVNSDSVPGVKAVASSSLSPAVVVTADGEVKPVQKP